MQKIIQSAHGYNKGAVLENCPSITTSAWEANNFLAETIIYDDYNGRIKADQSAIGTLTTNCGNDAERNGVKIIEYVGVGVNPISKKLEFDGYHDKECPTLLATDYKAPKTVLYNNYRIRKLTPKECWRLMGFSDSDFNKAKASGVSDSQLYKRAGNSIVVPALEALFKNLF